MTWEDQGRQYHEWFGHGTAPVKLKPIADKASSTEDSLDERLRSLVHGAVGALAKRLRRQAETQLQAGTLGRLTEAMAAWVHGGKMDAASFARHFFGRAADDPVVGSLRAAVSEAVQATTRPQLAAASGDLAKAMTAVGLDGWPRFVADAQARAHEKATLAAIQKSLQPPDVRKDAIKPVYPVETALAAGAAAVTGGVSGLVGAAARAIGGAITGQILADRPASATGEPSSQPMMEKQVETGKPSAAESASHPLLTKEIVSPGGEVVGKVNHGARSEVRTLGSSEFEVIKRKLLEGATQLDKPRYLGTWYKRFDGSEFGVRNSQRHGMMIDVRDPTLHPSFRIHQK